MALPGSEDSLERVGRLLRRIRAKRWLFSSLRLFGLLASLLALHALICLGWFQGMKARSESGWIGIAIVMTILWSGLGFLAWKYLSRLHLQFPRAIEAVALDLERRFPQLDRSLISALEFRRLSKSGPLHDLLNRRTAEELARLPVTKDPGNRPLFFVLIIAMATWIGFWMTQRAWPGTWLATWQRLLQVAPALPSSVTPDWSIGDLSLRLRYPAYTGLGEKTVQNSDGRLEAPRGTRVIWSAVSSERLRDVAVEIDAGPRISATLGKDQRRILAEWELTQGESYRLIGTSEAGDRLRSQSFEIRILADEKPVVFLKKPEADSTVARDAVISIAFEASDDFGLGKIEARLKVGREERVQVLRTLEPSQRQESGEASVTLSDHDVKPGEQVVLFLRVYDNDTVTGPKWADSEARTLRILSPRDLAEQRLAQQQAVFETWVLSLAEGLDERRGALGPQLQNVKRGMGQLLEQSVQPSDSDEKAKSLQTTLESLQKIIGTIEEALAANQIPWPSIVDWLETAVLRFERLMLEERLHAMEAMAGSLQEKMEHLKKLMAEGKLEEAKAAMQALRDEYAAYQQEMSKAMQAMPAEEFLNRQALEQLASESVPGALNRMEKALESGDLEAAKAELEKMKKEWEEGRSQFQDKRNKRAQEIAGKLQRGMERMDEVIRGQEKLVKESESLRDRNQKQAENLVAKQMKDRRERIEAEMKKIRTQLMAFRNDFRRTMKNPALTESSDVFLDWLHEHLSRLGEDVQSAGFGQASERIKLLDRDLRRFQESVANLQRFADLSEADSDRQMKHLDRSIESVEKIQKLLEEGGESQQMPKSKEMKQKMSSLEKAQQGIRERAQSLKKELEEVSREAPDLGLPKDSFGGEQQDAPFPEMRQAEDHLEKERLPEAISSERDALNQLRRSREEMRQALQKAQQQGQRGQGSPMSLPNPATGTGERQGSPSSEKEKVQIPGRDQYAVPEEFRRDVLDAMKEQSPSGYERLNREYYEDLVR